ncbi:MAG: papain-like cysteine protease family protein [Candidatus Rhabdochlamydia sp.]
MAGLILGMGLLIAPFFTASLGIPASACFVVTGGALITAALTSEKVNLPPRKYPPISLLDTVKIIIDDQGKQVIESTHGRCNIFEDKEIIAHHPVIREELLEECKNLNTDEEEKVYIEFTQNNKAIIQQQATRGCTAATAAMLIKDRGGKPDFTRLQFCNLGNDEDIQRDIQNAGFKPIVTPLVSNSLDKLRAQLLEYGSAIVSIWDPQAGGHSMIVDEVSKNLSQVRLRDPYHGWEITVSAGAFQSRWKEQTIIQIENKASCVHSQKDHWREP